jgi:uncharacterized LabA/DUF88 family protein
METNLTQRPILTMVYVDYGACSVNAEKAYEEITPDRIEPFILSLTERGSNIKKYLFSDIRGVERDEGRTFNRVSTKWYEYGYTDIVCPRSSQLRKESIDSQLIQDANREADIFSATHDLHFILVIGDVDYRPLIVSLIERGIKVSIIATRPHGTLANGVLERCHICFAVGWKPEDAKVFRSLDETAIGLLSPLTVNLLERYTPTKEQVKVFSMFLSSTHCICPQCDETFLTGHFLSHRCNGMKHASPGIPTKGFIQELTKAMCGYTPKDYIEWLMVQTKDEALPEVIEHILNEVECIPWDTVETILLAQRIWKNKMTGYALQGADKNHIDTLVLKGIIKQANGDLYFPADPFETIRYLIEQVNQRLLHQNVMRLRSRDGATTGDEQLRKQITKEFTQPFADFLPKITDPDDPRLWESNVALFNLTRPDVLAKQALCEKLDELHAVNQWYTRLHAFFALQEMGVLDAFEALMKDNPFIESESLAILVSNGVLVFDEKQGTVKVNLLHVWFTSCSSTEQAVA